MDETQPKKNVRPAVTIVLLIVFILFSVLFFVSYLHEKANEKKAILLLSDDATPQQRADHIQFLKSLAVDSSVVDISGCTPNPLVVSFKIGDKIWFVNKDAQSHTIAFDANSKYTLSPGESMPITFDMWSIPGVRKYTCDSQQPVGVVIAE